MATLVQLTEKKHLVTLAPTKLGEGQLSNMSGFVCKFLSFEADLSLAEMSPVDNVTF